MVYLRNNWKLSETYTGLTLFSSIDYNIPETPKDPSGCTFQILPPTHPSIISLYELLLNSPKSKKHTKSQTEDPTPNSLMALTRLALKNLQKRALVSSSPAAALIRSFSSIDVSDQSSKIVPKSQQGKKKWLWRNNGSEFHLGNSLIQAAENINKVLKGLNLSRPWWVSGGRVKEQEECYKLRLEMPGISKEDVKVTVEGRILSIRGEHREEEGEESGDGWMAESVGYYDMAMTLPEDAVAEEIKAELKDGVLMIVIPRNEKAPKDVKEITVS